MILRISHFFPFVKLNSGFPEITRRVFFMYTIQLINFTSSEVTLLNLSAIEFRSLKDYYKNYNEKGLCPAPADCLAQIANFIGLEERKISIKEISDITGYHKTQCYEHLAKGKLAGLVERNPTGKKNNYSIKLHIPEFVLTCTRGLDKYIFDVIEHAYGNDLLFSRECIISIATKTRFIGKNLLFESLQQTINDLIQSQKLYCNNNILKPKILDDICLKNNCITISSLNKKYSNLNEAQSYFLDWISRTCDFYLSEVMHQDQDQIIHLYVLPYKDLKQFKTDRLQYDCETKTYSINGEIVE